MNRGRGLAAAFGIYTIASVALLYHRGLLAGTIYLGIGSDPSLYIWMFRFLPKAVAHLQNPFVLQAAWAPFGLNITQATTTPLLALLAWPITALVGPVVAFNIVSMAVPVLAATSCFAFANAYTKNWEVALLAGWIFGFSTAVFAPLLGHLQTDFVAFVPLAFLAVTQRGAGNLGTLEFFFLLGLVLIAQFLTSLETFITEAIFLFLFAFVTEVSRPSGFTRLVRLRTNNLVVGLIAVYTAVAVAMAPFIYYFFHNYSQIPPLLQDGSLYSQDLLNFVIPTPVTWIGGRIAFSIATRFPGNIVEQFGYIGVPLVLLTIFAAWRIRHDRRAWPLLALLGCSFVFVLGPRLQILGRPTIRLPWALLEKLPLLQNALPSRLMIFLMLGVSGIFVVWIDRLERRRWIALYLLASAAVCTLPATLVQTNWWNTQVPTAPLFSSGKYRDLIQQGDTVLFLPFNSANGDAMIWQAETNGYFRMVNGFGNFVPVGLDSWPAAKMLEANAPNSDFPQQFEPFARANGIDEVIVPASILSMWNAALESCGWHPKAVGNLTVFTKPPRTRSVTQLISDPEAR